MEKIDIAIIGAGPYGLSTAAHLHHANGWRIRVFGQPMSFWENHMPTGMLLRSPLEGSHLSDPGGKLRLQAFQAATGESVTAPLPLTRFAGYGHWFQTKAVTDLDPRKVDSLEKSNSTFKLTLEDGEPCHAQRVIVAAGILPFAWVPPVFRDLPRHLASHSCLHRDLKIFAGKKVAVIGGGQSALESAALLHEAGADVEVLVRARQVRWLWRHSWVHRFRPVTRMLYAPADVGQAGVSHLVARPNLFRRLPRSIQDRLGVRAIRPAGAAWLEPRCRDVRFTIGREVTSAVESGRCAKLVLNDGSERCVDHILLATGFRVDIFRYPFLAKNLLSAIRHVGGYPRLTPGFETSVAGLHFLGAPAAWSFGPLMRFVAGADFASRNVTRSIVQQHKGHRHS
ncbi:MAG TPA: FAD-dependent oxidoreductase [Candidatus Acidoferrum sp.]|nr:FAD-dependent oxidoreductase [Candidatus Acidoferrum sp.]